MDGTHDPTPAPVLPIPDVPAQARPAIFYRDNDTYVTDTWLVVAGRRYAVRQLSNLRTVSGTRSPLTMGAAIMSGVVAVVVLLTARYLNTAGWIGAGIVLAVPLVVLAGELLRARRRYELWAEYRGMTVRLLCEDSAERYADIRRALTFAGR
ncbi:MAG: hypothetical protein V7603_2638 [Micromonosporaceae bacterium]